LAAADFDFAWQHALPPRLLFSADRLSLPQQLSQSLWRHLPSVAISWESCRPDFVDTALATLLDIPRISALAISWTRLMMKQWRQLSQSSSFGSLTSLKLQHSPTPVRFSIPLAQLSRLSSLSIGDDCLAYNETLAALPQLPSLTCLQLSTRPYHGPERNPLYYDSIALCTNLRHLTLGRVLNESGGGYA